MKKKFVALLMSAVMVSRQSVITGLCSRRRDSD